MKETKPQPTNSTLSLLTLATIFGISIFAYISFSQYRLARLVVITIIITTHTVWSLKQNPKASTKLIKEHLLFAVLTLALFSFLIYYD